MTDQALVPSAVDPEVAAAMQLHDRLAPLRNALGLPRDITDSELQLFAMVAHRTGLDPFARQIYAVRRKGKLVFQDGIDGHRAAAERTGQYAGSDEPEFGPVCGCGKAPEGHPEWARVIVHRVRTDGVVVHQPAKVWWHEFAPDPISGDEAFMWRKFPRNQLAKCAEAAALRKAFPKVLGQVYVGEEMDQAGHPDNPAIVEAAALPSARERLAARRQAIEAGQGDETPDEPAPDDDAPADLAFAAGPDGEADEARVITTDAGLAADEFMRLVGGTDGVTHELVVAAARELFPDVRSLSSLTDQARGELWSRVLERIPAKSA